jgi:hypothetical protein
MSKKPFKPTEEELDVKVVEAEKTMAKVAEKIEEAEIKPKAKLPEAEIDRKGRPFLAVEQVRDMNVYPLTVYNMPEKYIGRWCNKANMSTGRRGIWYTIDRTHPDFKELRVEIDDSPELSYFSHGDLVLCCARRETVESRRQAHADKISKRTSRFEGNVKETMARVGREGVHLSNATTALLDKEEI